MAAEKPFVLNACFTLKPERRDEYLAIIAEDKKQTLATEPLATVFVCGEDATTPNKFHLHEEYIGQEGFDAHGKMPHFKPWADFVETDPFAEGGGIVAGFYYGTHEAAKLAADAPASRCAHAEYCVKAEFKDEFLKLAEETREECGKDESCARFVYGEDKDTPNTFHLFRAFDGQESYEAYTGSDQFKKWKAFSEKEPLTKAPVLSSYVV
uniref:ABM domain-containing protein n=1 Tax=Trieres chinensis TaxID=1514140 RepID=A0A7S2ESE5_TRICV|mmetsp:Transcript_35057/g.71736  ORF Transcript_35057/g.71736 Transcript_35057/m.71736 type:complete len:210 (+) Transcript_35057:109-738(+)